MDHCGPFGPNEVQAIANSLGTTTDTHRDLRLTVQELQQVGDLSPAASVRLGVGLYLLGRSSEAVTSLKSGDGSALALFALGLAQAALAATEAACASFRDPVLAMLPMSKWRLCLCYVCLCAVVETQNLRKEHKGASSFNQVEDIQS